MPNVYGLMRPPTVLPPEVLDAMADQAADFRRRIAADAMEAEPAALVACARMGMAAYSSRPMPLEITMPKAPYIPAGCDQQGRRITGRRATQWPHTGLDTDAGPLTEAELDQHNREFHATQRLLSQTYADSEHGAIESTRRKVEPWARLAGGAGVVLVLMLLAHLLAR